MRFVKFLKALAATVAIAIFLSAGLAGCSRPDVTLVIKTGVHQLDDIVDSDTPDAYTFLKKAAADFASHYKDAHLTIELSQYESGRRKQEIDECFGTKHSPDILFASQFNMSTYVNNGFIVPIDDLISDDVRADIADDIWENCRLNGKTYMMPFVTTQNVLCFNKKLFKAAGLERLCQTDEVQSWSLDEWDDVLSTLAASLPPSTYPMMMFAADDQGDTHVMVLLRSRGCSFFDANGYVNLENDYGISALDWLRSACARGFFPPRPERLVIMDNYDLFINGQLAIYLGGPTLQIFFDEQGIDCGYVNFPSSDGKGYTTSFDMCFGVIDNHDSNKLKAAKSFVKYIYESHWLDYSAGSIPVSRRVGAKYASELSDVSRYIKNKGRNVNFTANNPNWLGVRAVFYRHIYDLFATDKDVHLIAKEIDSDCNSAIETGRINSRPHE